MEQNVHKFQLTETGKKRNPRMTTIDFTIIQGQQNFGDDAEIIPIKIKIENDKI